MKDGLSPSHRKLVAKQIKSGHYSSASEVLSDALRLLDQRNTAQAQELREFYASIRRGRDDLRSGRFIPIEELTIEKIREGPAARTAPRRSRKTA